MTVINEWVLECTKFQVCGQIARIIFAKHILKTNLPGDALKKSNYSVMSLSFVLQFPRCKAESWLLPMT